MAKPQTTIDRWLAREVPAASLAVFRVLFGLLLCGSTIRFVANGWVEKFFVERTFFFDFWIAPGVRPLEPAGMYTLVLCVALGSLGIALGLFYRVSAAVVFFGFTYVELIDVTNYLNHYYLGSLVCGLLMLLPLHRVWSLDAWRKPELSRETLPALYLWVLRFQFSVVYVYAGLAKLGSDWLIDAQPLTIWLRARQDTFLIGPLLEYSWVPYAFSWGGFVFDLTIVAWLRWSKTRVYAYALVVVFHCTTGALFNIGIFPLMMMVGATLFLSPAWPSTVLPQKLRAWLSRSRSTATSMPKMWGKRLGLWAVPLGLYCCVQLVLPLRHWWYPGNVLWTEEGMRFSWRVMVRAKKGSVQYRVTLPTEQRSFWVEPRRYLSAYQTEEMSGQPDLILQLAHHIGNEYRQRGHEDVEVRVRSRVSLNGRPPAALIDPGRNLLLETDGLLAADWVSPLQTTADYKSR